MEDMVMSMTSCAVKLFFPNGIWLRCLKNISGNHPLNKHLALSQINPLYKAQLEIILDVSTLIDEVMTVPLPLITA